MSVYDLPIFLLRVMTSLLCFLLRPLEGVFRILVSAPTVDCVLLSMWIVVVGYFRFEILALEVGMMNAAVLLAALLGVMWSDSVLNGKSRGTRVWKRTYVQHTLHLAIYVSLPLVLLFYVWRPLQEMTPCLLRAAYDAPWWLMVHPWRPATLGSAAATLTALLLYLLSQRAKSAGKGHQAALREQTTQTSPPKAARPNTRLSTPPRSPSRLCNTSAHTPITRSMTRLLLSREMARSTPGTSSSGVGGRMLSSKAANPARMRTSTAPAEQSRATERRERFGNRSPAYMYTTLDT